MYLKVFISTLVLSTFVYGSDLNGSRPNIVFFLTDDQSLFDYTAYGSKKAPTPISGAFAKESLVFNRAYTAQAICAPSRSTLYSGLYPIKHGCFINHTEIRPGVKTIPNYLKPLGYDVILAGKSHVKPNNQFEWTEHFHPVPKEVTGKPRPSIPSKKIANLFKTADKPFCLMVACEFPHGPFFKETSIKPEDVDLQPFRNDTLETRIGTTKYYESIAESEREFKILLDLIDQYNLTDDTIVIFASDHGMHDGKFTVYDRGLHVPFIVRWPGKIKPGRTDALINFVDFVPTIIDLAGGKIPETLDGKSLVSIFERKKDSHHDYVYGVGHRQGTIGRYINPQRSISDGRYHYIFNFNSLERIERERKQGKKINYFIERGAKVHPNRPEEEMYDILNDPHEMKNIADNPTYVSKQNELKKELFKWMESQNDYLNKDGEIIYLSTIRHPLDYSEKFNAFNNYVVPKELEGTLNGLYKNPHSITAQ